MKKCADCTFCQIDHETAEGYIYSCSAPGYPGVGYPMVGNEADIQEPAECWFNEVTGIEIERMG